jgi:hypothetical protein
MKGSAQTPVLNGRELRCRHFDIPKAATKEAASSPDHASNESPEICSMPSHVFENAIVVSSSKVIQDLIGRFLREQTTTASSAMSMDEATR